MNRFRVEMIDFLVSHLGDNLGLLNKTSKNMRVQVYRKYEFGFDPETFVELNESDNKFHLYQVQRDKKFKKAIFSDEKDALFALGIYAVSILGNQIQNVKIRDKILKLKPDDFSLLNNILVQEVGAEYFSIKQEKAKVINLEEGKDSGLFNIYYLTNLNSEKEFLVKDRKAPSAFLVLYNFAIKLKNGQSLIDRWNEDFKVTQEQIELAKKIYLGLK